VAIIPIVYKGREEHVVERCHEVRKELARNGLRTVVDDRKEVTPGNKYFTWELRGAPVRIELGPRDLEAGTAVLVRRDTLQKTVVKINSVAGEIKKLLTSIDANLVERNERWMSERISKASTAEDARKTLNQRGGIIEAPWCGNRGCGEELEVKLDARILGVPYNEGYAAKGQTCVNCDGKADKTIRIARSY